MTYSVGSLVTARGREWVVLPESKDEQDVLILRPLGGTEDEVTGICTLIEEVKEATFPLPNPEKELGNHLSCRLLRDAVRLGFRSGAGPFRSMGRIGPAMRFGARAAFRMCSEAGRIAPGKHVNTSE